MIYNGSPVFYSAGGEQHITIFVKTADGLLSVGIDDYIVIDEDGIYPVKGAVFERDYEVLD